jgi:opacity protein-like surface antigen
MRINRVLLASTALALFAGVGQAQADDDLYLDFFGGANFLADDSGNFGALYSTDADTGFVVGAAFGTELTNWAKGLSTELAVSYRRNDLGGTWSGGLTAIEGNMATFAILVNTWYEFNVGSKFRPYVGGGAGWGRMNGDLIFTGGSRFVDVSNTGFSWQLGAGIHYEVMEDVDVGIGYRWFRGPELEFFGGSNDIDNENHEVSVNLKIGINPP